MLKYALLMAFLRINKVKTARGNTSHYYYIVESRRRNDKIRQKVLEYLGRDPDPKRLKRALVYWGVKDKRRRK